MMKKIFLPLSICFFALMFIACDFGRDKAVMRLVKACRYFTERCPLPAGKRLVCDSSGIEDGYLVFFLRINDKEPYLLSLFRKNKAEYKEQIKNSLLSNADENGIALMKEIKKSQGGMVLRVRSATTGREINFRYTPEEVAEITDRMLKSVFEDAENIPVEEVF